MNIYIYFLFASSHDLDRLAAGSIQRSMVKQHGAYVDGMRSLLYALIGITIFSFVGFVIKDLLYAPTSPCLCTAPPAAEVPSTAPKQRKPNVVLLISDDLNTWLRCYGEQQAITPNIDRIAAMGISFNRSYTSAPLCNPSRTSFLSGMRPDRTRVFNNPHDWTRVPKRRMITTAFRRGGYAVKELGRCITRHDNLSGTNTLLLRTTRKLFRRAHR